MFAMAGKPINVVASATEGGSPLWCGEDAGVLCNCSMLETRCEIFVKLELSCFSSFKICSSAKFSVPDCPTIG